MSTHAISTAAPAKSARPGHIERTVHPEVDLCIHRVEGDLRAATYRRALATLPAVEFRATHHLWDLRRARLRMDAGTVEALAHEGVAPLGSRRRFRIAILAEDDLTFGIVRQGIMFAESAGWTFDLQAFREAAEAFAWLGLDPAMLGRGRPLGIIR